MSPGSHCRCLSFPRKRLSGSHGPCTLLAVQGINSCSRFSANTSWQEMGCKNRSKTASNREEMSTYQLHGLETNYEFFGRLCCQAKHFGYGQKRSLVAGFFTNPSEQKICRVRQIGGCFTPRFGMNIAFSFLKPPDRRNHDFPCRFWYGQSFASRVKTSMSLSYLDFDLHFRKLQGSVKGLVKVFV